MARTNSNLHKAKADQVAEFYTTIEEIEDQLRHYDKKLFEGKTIYCNCDDPFESNFFKYFALRFNSLKLKKLICTCFDQSPIAGAQLSLFEDEIPKEKKAYKVELTDVTDVTGNGACDIEDIRKIVKTNKKVCKPLKGNGDFRSKECIKLLEEADMVITNPPFNLFREYIAQLFQYKKDFLIIGNKNAITYKEIFPLIRDNKMWLGAQFPNGNAYFYVPESVDTTHFKKGVYNPEKRLVKFRNCCWFTNLDIDLRHETLLSSKQYKPEDYPKYDNYDAINVDKVADIPVDYDGVMGVPITFLDKYNPDQFEIVAFRKGDDGKDLVFTRERERESSTVFSSPCATAKWGLITGAKQTICEDGKSRYARVAIRRKM